MMRECEALQWKRERETLRHIKSRAAQIGADKARSDSKQRSSVSPHSCVPAATVAAPASLKGQFKVVSRVIQGSS